jgi:hypothetical protein
MGVGKKRGTSDRSTGLMDLKRFWDIIAFCCGHDASEEEWDDALVEQLARLAPLDMARFDNRFTSLTDAAYRVDLWGAAYLINGGASDDGFYYFCCWLVGMGKTVYEAALASPDNLADHVEPDEEREAEIYSVACRAYERATGKSAEEYYALRDKIAPPSTHALQGEDWDFDDDDEVRRRLPRLTKLYLDPDEE